MIISMRIFRSNDENIRWPKHEVTQGPDHREVHTRRSNKKENKNGILELPEILTYFEDLERFFT
jgi:hypothetical protein